MLNYNNYYLSNVESRAVLLIKPKNIIKIITIVVQYNS